MNNSIAIIGGGNLGSAIAEGLLTPKGRTIAGLNEMEHQGFSSSLIKGIATSYNKIVKG